MTTTTEIQPPTGRAVGHVREGVGAPCMACDLYVQAFRSVLLPIVGRAVTRAEVELKPAVVLERIRAGAHRRGHVLGLLS